MHKVSIILKIRAKQTEMAAYLTIREDTEPPVIEAEDMTFMWMKGFYRRNVRVNDNRDAEVELIVDSSKVNLKRKEI